MTIPTDLEQIKADINRAQAWAKKRFNVGSPSGFLDPPVSEIDFDGDGMDVWPVLYSKRMGISVNYRLKWKKGRVGWEGYGILSGQSMCWLEVK